MHALQLDSFNGASRKLLCLGAHADDIEIGCGGTLLKLIRQATAVHWVVFSADPLRAEEAMSSAEKLLSAVPIRTIVIHKFRDGFFPSSGSEIKEYFEQLKHEVSPDVVFTHYRGDLHQDHRLISELTWNTFRDHLILEYEVPKYDGDLGAPNVFVPLDEADCRQKIEHLVTHFKSQQTRRWFSEDLFLSLLRLRGMECNAPARFAEGFYCRKLVLEMLAPGGIR